MVGDEQLRRWICRPRWPSIAPRTPASRRAVEYLGKRGAQIVLTASQAPQLVLAAESMEAARQACADAGVTVDNGWERELTELARPTHDLWRSKSRRPMNKRRTPQGGRNGRQHAADRDTTIRRDDRIDRALAAKRAQ